MNTKDIWKEGKYLDMWSVVHFLSGVVFTGWMLIFGFNIWIIFISYSVLAIVWEFVEIFQKVREHTANRVTDVIVGILGSLVAYLFTGGEGKLGFPILIFFTVIFLLLQVVGFIAYKKRNKKK